jgi:hypothetical protein
MGAKRQCFFSRRSFCTGGQSGERSSMFTKWLLQTEECFIATPNTVEINLVETQEIVVTESDFERSKYFENVFTDDKRLMST